MHAGITRCTRSRTTAAPSVIEIGASGSRVPESSVHSCELESLRPFLMRYAAAKTNNFHLAEDLVQETMLTVLTGKSSFMGRSTLRTWVTSILHFKIIDAFRHNAIDSRHFVSAAATEADAAMQEDQIQSLAEAETRDGLVDPAVAVERRQLADRLRGAVDSLPTRQREAFVLVHMHGLSGREAAERVGVSQDNLWVILHRSRKSLQSQLVDALAC